VESVWIHQSCSVLLYCARGEPDPTGLVAVKFIVQKLAGTLFLCNEVMYPGLDLVALFLDCEDISLLL
jgi:hypothetical protein